jgi:hypothetical protein
MLPAWFIDETGRLTDWDVESYASRLGELRVGLGSPARGDTTLLGTTARLLGSESMQLEAQARVRLLWRAMVEEWLGLPWTENWTGEDSLRVTHRGKAARGMRTRQVEALVRSGPRRIGHLRSVVETASGAPDLRRTEITEARVDSASLRPLQVHVRQAIEGAAEPQYEELLLRFRWPDLPR